MPERVAQGVYISGLNPENLLPRGQRRPYEYSFPELGMKGSFGVCDNWEQVLKYYGELLNNPVEYYIVSLALILKESQHPTGGWRWHKWGPYIGNLKPTQEYLYDEPLIDQVYVYQVTRLFDDEIEGV
jgi:hypothetical protein